LHPPASCCEIESLFTLPNTEKTDHFSNEMSPESLLFEVDFIAKIRTSPFGISNF